MEYLAGHDLHVYLVIYDRNAFLISRNLYANIQAYIDDSAIDPEYALQERRRRVSNTFTRPAEGPKSKALPGAKKPGILPSFRRRKAERETTAEKPAEGILWDSAPAFTAPMAMPPNLEDYISDLDESFRDMLLRKIDEKQMTDAECYRKANIDRKLFNKIKNQADYRPGKSTVLALAISLHLPMAEIREMLGKAGFSLSRSSKSDRIVEYFLMQGNYNIYEINEALFSFDQKLLGSVTWDS